MTVTTAVTMALLLLTVVVSRPGDAAEPRREAPSVAVVLLAHALSAEKGEVDRLQQAVRGSLRASGFVTIWAPEPTPAPTADLRIEIDLLDRTRPVLTLVPRVGAPTTRPVILTHGLDDVGCEVLAQIIESATASLLAPGGPSSSPSPAPTPPSPVPERRTDATATQAATPAVTLVAAAPASSPSHAGASVEAFYAASFVGAGSTLIQGPGVAVSGAPYGRRMTLSASYALPATFQGDIAGYTLSGITLRFGGALASWGQPTWLEIDSRFGLDLLSIHSSSEIGPALQPAADRLWATPTFGVSASLLWRIDRRAAITLTALFDLEYLLLKVDGSTVPHPFFQPWGYRPGLALGVRWR
jgi:hypothetical protein